MEAQEVRYNSLIERLGENKEFAFTFNFPVNTTWELVHVAIANMIDACKELEAKQKEMEAAAKSVAEPVASEVVA